MHLRGLTADLRWSYLVAATIGPWELDGTSLSGTIQLSDAYRLSQCPLTAWLRMGRQELTYPVLSATISGDQIICEVGPRVRMYETQGSVY